MPNFNPADARVDMAWQPTAGLPVAVAAFDKPMRSLAGTVASPEWTNIVSQSIDGSGHMSDSLPGAINMGPFAYPTEIHFGETPYLLAAAMGSGAQTNPVGSVYQQWLATRQSGTSYGPYMALVIDRDDGLPYVLGDLRVSQFVLTVVKNEITKCAFQIGGAWYSVFTDRIVDTGSDVPLIKGIPEYATLAHATSTERAYKFQISTALSGTTVVVKGQAGVATAYGATTTSVEVDTWTTLLDSDTGLPLGDPGQPIQIYLPSGGTYALNDEYHFDIGRASLTTALDTLGFANEVNADIFLDGSAICLETFTLTVDFPFATKPCIGQRWPSKTLRQGKIATSLTIGRLYDDLSLHRRLAAGQTARFLLSLFGDSAFSDDTRPEISFYLPKLTPSGLLAPFSDDNFTESITLAAQSDSSDPFGNGVVDPIEIICKNNISDLSA